MNADFTVKDPEVYIELKILLRKFFTTLIIKWRSFTDCKKINTRMRASQFIIESGGRIKLTGFGRRSEQSQKFVDKINSLYPASPMSKNYRLMMLSSDQMVQFELVPKEKNWVEIKWLQSTPMRGGGGSRALGILKRYAEEAGINYKLYVWEQGVVSKSKLIKFYKRNGFKRVGNTQIMTWESSPRSI